jgi:hypothetical protein
MTQACFEEQDIHQTAIANNPLDSLTNLYECDFNLWIESIHKGENIAAAAGATLIYLPPYSPDFSQIENCWSKIKSFLRSMAARNYPDLLKALEDAFKLPFSFTSDLRCF